MAKKFRQERCMSEQLDDLMVTRIAESQQTTSSVGASDTTIWEQPGEDPMEEDRIGREKTPEELDAERQKEEDREEAAEDDDNDPKNQEAEMTMFADSQKPVERDEAMDVDEEVEDDEELNDKGTGEVIEISSDGDDDQ